VHPRITATSNAAMMRIRWGRSLGKAGCVLVPLELEFASDDLILIEIAWGYCADKLIGLNVSKLGGVPYAM